MNLPFDDWTSRSDELNILGCYLQAHYETIPAHIESVRKVISCFSCQNNLEYDQIIIENFPVRLASEFNALCDGRGNYQDSEGVNFFFWTFSLSYFEIQT
ncbi:hypothetical protein RF11_01021 [Thelohanellus kitauei]|uniref:Uncharacterized protein n=1 Tax=Thelohanellus kitauei TaxID=669202 RepID=A0A0C2NLY3_THEKT|nr:hypothetical protein RF11_01021 [Thelohanellus kitauei]